MAAHAADRNLLFGIMAVQSDFVARDALIEAMGAWVLDKSKPLGQILVERGHLTPERCALLDALVNEHVRLHDNDPEKSLAAVASVSSLRQELSQIADPDLQASLLVVGSARAADIESTQTYVPSDTGAGLRYRILRPYAKGGLGEVFVAEDLELHREVALKEMQSDRAQDAESRARFLLEAEVTGRLEHPGIVPVYGLGQYADGRPYYAMRFIHGDNLKQAIRRFHEDEKPGRDPGERSLALRQLLGRFVDVCNAVAYAHSRGVLHRDLKPGNVMLGKYGETLVVDWGLAKTVGRTEATKIDEEGTLKPISGSGVAATQMGSAIGTPPYMSPEQAAGQLDRVGPASDVYSLGATLYTLLTGQPPFHEDDRGQLLQKVQQGDFEPPRQVNRAVSAPLEAVCLKAMARQPEDRYPTARALALDIEHWLADEPVSAWPEPVVVRAQRWARRHRALVASAAATLLVATVASAVGFLIVSAAYDKEYAARVREEEAKQRADANFGKAMAAVDDYLTKISETRLLESPGTQPLRKELLTSALGFYLAFLEERKDDPEVQAAVAAAYLRVAKIHNAVGDAQERKKALAEALQRFEELVNERPDDLELQHGLAECHFWGGQHTKAIPIWQELCRTRPNDAKFLKGLAGALNSLALDQDAKGNRKEALQSHQEALALQDQIIQLQPEDPEAHVSISRTLNNVGVLLAKTGNPKDALAMYQRALHHAEIAYAKMPGVTSYGRSVAVGLQNAAGILVAMGDKTQEPLDMYRRALEIRQRLARENPGAPGLLQEAYQVHFRLVNLLRQMGRLQEAAESDRQVQAFIEAIPTKTSGNWYDLACARARCSEWLADGTKELSDGEKREREKLQAQAVQALQRAVNQGYSDVEHAKTDDDLKSLHDREDFKALIARMQQAEQARKLAKEATSASTPAEKLKAAEQARAISEKLAGEEPANLRHQVDLALSLYAIGTLQRDVRDYERAEQSLSRALALREKIAQQSPESVEYRTSLGATHMELGKVQWPGGRHKEAEASWDKGVKLFEACIKEAPEQQTLKETLSGKLIEIGDEYAKLALWEEATEFYTRAFELHEPSDAWQWLQYGYLLVTKRDHAAYRSLCKRAFHRFGTVTKPEFGLSHAAPLAFLCSCGPDSGVDRKEVVKLVEMGLALQPKEISLNFLASIANSRAGDFEKALQRAKQALATGPADPKCMVTLALAYHHRGDRGGATYWLAAGERAFEEELRWALGKPYSNPVNPNTWRIPNEALILDREAHMTIRGRPAPEIPWIRLLQGRSHAHIGKPEKAEKDFTAAVEPRPSDPQVWIGRGRIFAELGQHSRAEADFAKAVALAPNDPRPWIARGRYFAERGKHKEADADFAKAAGLSPDELNVFPESGWWVAGPYPVDISVACSPEQNQSPEKSIPAAKREKGWETKWLQWRPVATDANGLVNLGRVFETQPLPGAAGSYYGLCYIYSPNQRDAILHVGSAAPIRVWLNDKLVHESRDPTWMLIPGAAPVVFQGGRNKVLVKVSCTADNHLHFYCRVDDSKEDRAFALANKGLWEEAARLLAQENEKTAVPHLHYARLQTALSLFAGKGRGHRETLARYADRFALILDRAEGVWSAWTILQSLDFDAKSVPLVSLAEIGRSSGSLKDPFLGFHIARANLRVGKYPEADTLAKTLDQHNYPPNDFLLAMTSFKLGDKEEARKRLKKAEDWYLTKIRAGLQAPSFVMPFLWEEWGESQIIYREAKTLVEGKPYTDEPLWLIATGRERALLGFNERAEKDFQEAVTLRPDDAEVWAWRGRVFAQLGRLDAAAADLHHAEKLAKGPQQLFDLARMYSFAAGAAAAVKPQPPPASASKYRDAWAAQALACLKQAVAAGWKDAARLEQEKDLEALRGHPEFQNLVKALKQQPK